MGSGFLHHRYLGWPSAVAPIVGRLLAALGGRRTGTQSPVQFAAPVGPKSTDLAGRTGTRTCATGERAKLGLGRRKRQPLILASMWCWPPPRFGRCCGPLCRLGGDLGKNRDDNGAVRIGLTRHSETFSLESLALARAIRVPKGPRGRKMHSARKGSRQRWRGTCVVVVVCWSLFAARGTLAQLQQPPQGTKPAVKEQHIEQSNQQPDRPPSIGIPDAPAPANMAVGPYSVKPIGACSPECSKPQPEKDWWHEFRTDPIATFTGLMFFATALLWWSTRGLVKGAERTAERQLRAYVFVDAASISGLDDSDKVAAVISIKNTGQTPAARLMHLGGMALTAYPPAEDFPFHPSGQGVPQSRGSLGPGMRQGKFNVGEALGSDQKRGLQDGAMAIYVFGRIDYEDAFGKPRFTSYRFMVGGNAGVHGENLSQCEEGNDAT